MNNYTTYCTSEQTRKALELGAPIETCGYYYKKQIGCNTISDTDLHIIPTTDQMIGWLEEQGQTIEVCRLCRNNQKWSAFVDDTQIVGKYYLTRKEAILDAIDAALEYLINNKK